jgi:hypothetical protein
MNRARLAKNATELASSTKLNLHEQKQHASSIRHIKNNFVRMKKNIILVFILAFAFSQSAIKSESLTIQETLNYINTLLKANPYIDNFLEITFYYSVDITSNNELVVVMESKGSFKSILKSKISDLDHFFQKDFCKETSNSICWYCKPEDLTKDNGCVYNEIIISGGEKENHSSDNICVMFSNQNEICDKLYHAFDNLFTKVLESELKD